jgi:SnoaL-like domain
VSARSEVVTAGHSPLDDPPAGFAGRPFLTETLTLLRSVRDHDYDTLAALCDDDFGIVDGDPAGVISIIRTREEWERWFLGLFATLRQLGARTDSEVLRYDALQHATMGFSALEFRQFLEIDGSTATFECVATIVWKLTPSGWREARWHVSVVGSHGTETLRPPDVG